MGLQPGESLGTGQSAETEAHERMVDSGGTVSRPAFTPPAREASDGTVPDDLGTQTPAKTEPAENYTGADDAGEPAVDAGEPAEARPAMNADEGAGNHAAETDQVAAAHETPAGHETREAGTAEPVTAEPTTVPPTTSTTSTTPTTPSAPAVLADMDQPLLSTDTELLARWQQVQVAFINDPHAAVAGAADLVEQAGQALHDALEQRQRQMRTMWDRDSASGPSAQRDTQADTEQMRQMMQRYQALFNQLYQTA